MLIYVWLILIFVLGAVIGSGLNVCISRIPYEKSILWPSSRCDQCLKPIRWSDNLPLFSYWILGGKCRSCGQSYSSRHFWIELFTGACFVGVFYLTVQQNVLGIPTTNAEQFRIEHGDVPRRLWLLWGAQCTLVSFLIVASMTDLEHFEIPLPLTITGMIVGIILGMSFAWPYPTTVLDLNAATGEPTGPKAPIHGLQLWPIWHPLPDWLPAGSWKLGLVNSLAGIVAGAVVLRMVRFLFALGRGKEGLGMGDADLMMMAGAFLGWQAVVIAFFVSVFPALVLGIGQIIVRGDQMIPFGPSLALGLLITLFCWKRIAPAFELLFFDATMLTIIAVTGALALLLISLLLRVMGPPDRKKEKQT